MTRKSWSIPIHIRKVIENARDVGQRKLPTSFNLNYSNLNHFPEELTGFTHLKSISFHQHPKIREIPASISNLTELHSLKLSRCGFKLLPSEIATLEKLDTFILDEGKLMALPKEFGNLPNLRRLSIYDNQLEFLPKSFGNLSKLEILLIHSNSLYVLPDSFKNLQSLQKLNIDNNEFSEFPKVLLELKSLEVLQIFGYSFSDFPSASEIAAAWPKLRKLNVDIEIYEEIHKPLGFILPDLKVITKGEKF